MALTFARRIEPQSQPAQPAQAARPVPQAPANSPGPVAAPRQRAPLAVESTDVRLLCAIAATQLRYGRPEEAAGYLMALRRLAPQDEQVRRLLALALMKLERWEQAEQLIDEMEASTPGERLLALWRSLVQFRTGRLLEAREWFQRFIGWKV